MSGSETGRTALEVYLHIPFCVKKCAYCDFLSAPGSKEQIQAYQKALMHEIRAFSAAKNYEVQSVFFGGGTPSLLEGESICALLAQLHETFSFADGAEISIECNPGTADRNKFLLYQNAGVNRLSFGLQSADNRELALLGRIHTWEMFRDSYEMAREAGFSNINIDLMSALPGQTEESWEKTLKQVMALKPEHLSAYSLILEEGTPFYERYQEDARLRDRGEEPRLLPSEEAERRMYQRTQELLLENGMQRYEISNYALPGRQCRHNLGYWTGVDYVGFGLGASSLLHHVRYQNPTALAAYLAGDFSGRSREALTFQDEMEEFMFLGLRLTRGISKAEFLQRFGRPIEQVYGLVLQKQQSLGLLTCQEDRVALTARGIDVSNSVMAEFLLSD